LIVHLRFNSSVYLAPGIAATSISPTNPHAATPISSLASIATALDLIPPLNSAPLLTITSPLIFMSSSPLVLLTNLSLFIFVPLRVVPLFYVVVVVIPDPPPTSLSIEQFPPHLPPSTPPTSPPSHCPSPHHPYPSHHNLPPPPHHHHSPPAYHALPQLYTRLASNLPTAHPLNGLLEVFLVMVCDVEVGVLKGRQG